MRKALTLILVSGSLLVATVAARPAATYYWCNSSTAKKYHGSESCRGLNNCTHGVVSGASKPTGRTACAICRP